MRPLPLYALSMLGSTVRPGWAAQYSFAVSTSSPVQSPHVNIKMEPTLQIDSKR